MTKVGDYFREKYNKDGPAYLQGVLRTLGVLPKEDEEKIKDGLKNEVLEK